MADIIASKIVNGTAVPTLYSNQGSTYAEVVSTVAGSSNTSGTKSAPASVSVTTSAIQLVAATTRKAVMFSNNGANAVYIGKDNTVTTSNGIQIASGGSFVDTLTSDAWYAIAGSGTNAVAVVTVS